MNKPVVVTEGGKKRRMRTGEALIRVAKMRALRDEKGAANEFWDILEITGRADDIPEEERLRRGFRLSNSLSREEYFLFNAPALEKERQRYLAGVDDDEIGSDFDDDAATPLPPAICRGDQLAANGEYEAALAAYREHISTSRSRLKDDGADNNDKEDVVLGAARIAILADKLLLAGHFLTARARIEEALTYAPHRQWMEMIRAHILMFTGRETDAKNFYLSFRSDAVVAWPSWESVILRDFAELREAGRSHPLMAEIEQRLTAAGWTTEGPARKSVAELQRDSDFRSTPFPTGKPTTLPTRADDAVHPAAGGTTPLVLSDEAYIEMNPNDIRSGDLLQAKGKFDRARAVYHSILENSEDRLGKDPNDTEAQRDMHEAAGRMDDLGFQFLLNRKMGGALECAEEAVQHEPHSLQHQLRLAHRLLFGRTTDARKVYEQHFGEELENGMTWENGIRRDFAAMREAGVNHGFMDEIERQCDSSETRFACRAESVRHST